RAVMVAGLGAAEPDSFPIGEKAQMVADNPLNSRDGHGPRFARGRRKDDDLGGRSWKKRKGPLAVGREGATIALSQTDGRRTIQGAHAHCIVRTAHLPLLLQKNSLPIGGDIVE